jgi:hypothetical protein
MRRLAWLPMVVLAAAAPLAAAAEPPKAPPLPPIATAPPPKPEKPKKKEKERLRQELLDQMRAERMWRMTEELRLDEASAAKVFPLLTKFDERAREVGKERNEIVTALNAELETSRPDDGRIKALIDRLLANRNRRQAVEQERFTALRQVLTAVQQAKLVLLLPKLEDSIRHRIRDTMEERRAERALGAMPARP